MAQLCAKLREARGGSGRALPRAPQIPEGPGVASLLRVLGVPGGAIPAWEAGREMGKKK